MPAEPDTRWTGIVALHALPLLGVQEDRPLLPGEIKGALQPLHIRHHAEAALGVGVIEGACRRPGLRRHAGLTSGRQFQQCLGRLRWQMLRQGKQCVLGRLPHVGEPFGRDAIAEQFIIGRAGE